MPTNDPIPIMMSLLDFKAGTPLLFQMLLPSSDQLFITKIRYVCGKIGGTDSTGIIVEPVVLPPHATVPKTGCFIFNFNWDS
eukprot:UN02434